MLPKLYTLVDTTHGRAGIVIFVGAAHFIVRYYNHGDYIVRIYEPWSKAAN